MASQQEFRVKGIRGASTRFKREKRKLSQDAHAQLMHVLDELLTGTLAPSRQLEKLSGFDSLYSVRLNRKQRLVFWLESDNTIRMVAVGNHDQAYSHFKPL